MSGSLHDREPFGPLVYRSRRGILHRARLDFRGAPLLHPRCAAGVALKGEVLTDEQALEWATGREPVLCRYPWCFRATLQAAGVSVEVGHMQRTVSLRGLRGRWRGDRPARHRPTPVEPVGDRGWMRCTCGKTLVASVDGHNPERVWWHHKRPRRDEVAA